MIFHGWSMRLFQAWRTMSSADLKIRFDNQHEDARAILTGHFVAVQAQVLVFAGAQEPAFDKFAPVGATDPVALITRCAPPWRR